jgi:hypothetical protein
MIVFNETILVHCYLPKLSNDTMSTMRIARYHVTKREGSYLHTESSNPWSHDRSWSTSLSSDLQAHLQETYVHWFLQLYATNRKYTTHDNRTKITEVHLLPAFTLNTHKHKSRATFSDYVHRLFTYREPKLFL